MFTAIIFIIVLGVLVLVHEWGHFVMARRAGMKVEEFGFGFPPRIWGYRHGETLYSINSIPFGGFVKILGENGEDKGDPQSFSSKGAWPRFLVLAAGVTMNFLLAVLLLIFGNFFGLRIGLDAGTMATARDHQLQVAQVFSDSPAEQAGIRLLDEVLAFRSTDGQVTEVKTVEEIQTFTSAHRGQDVTVIVARAEQRLELSAKLRSDTSQGALGIAPVLTGVVSYPWYESIWRGVENAVFILINTFIGYYELFRTLIVHGELMAEVSGPVGIAQFTGQAARVGFSYLMQFIALISINLAVLNILPLPAIDGGRIVFLLIEKLKGSPVSRRIEGTVNATGFALLLALMIYVTVKDVAGLL